VLHDARRERLAGGDVLLEEAGGGVAEAGSVAVLVGGEEGVGRGLERGRAAVPLRLRGLELFAADVDELVGALGGDGAECGDVDGFVFGSFRTSLHGVGDVGYKYEAEIILVKENDLSHRQ